MQSATLQINSLEVYLVQVEIVREDLAQFFCEDLASFKLEDCFKILFTFTTKWKQAAQENAQRKKQEAEAESRKKAREETLKKRTQVGWQNQNQLSAEEATHDRVILCNKMITVLNLNFLIVRLQTRGMALNPEDEIFIACSPRIVRRRLGSLSDNNGNGANGGQLAPDQLTLPSPGELRRFNGMNLDSKFQF
jgi:hypothetical protein